jgi:anti-sigma factor ChrR (cupin superfamily)
MENDSQQVLKLTDLFQISNWQHTLSWKPFREGVEIYRLYGGLDSRASAALLRYQPGARVGFHEHGGFEHILVLTGSQVDENSKSEAGTLIVNPPGTRHSVLTEGGCIVLAIYEKPVRFLEQTGSGQE